MHVFPIRGGTVDRHRGGWKELAASEPGAVAARWRRWPDDNVGVACGPSGLLVLDVDDKRGKGGSASLELLQLEHGPLPPTLTATTPSGGRHLYFAVPEPSASSVERVGRGLDVRSGGGYVLAPPSRTAVGAYAWDRAGPNKPAEAPAWLVELAGRPNVRAEGAEEPAAELDTEAALARVATFLRDDAPPAVQGSGGNSTTYQTACGARDLGASEGECLRLMLEHYSQRCEPPWPDDELAEVVAHAYAYAVGRPASGDPLADFPEDEAESSVPPTPRPAATRGGVYDEFVWAAIPQWFVRRSDGRRLSRQAMDSLMDFTVDRGHFSDSVFKSRTAMRKFVSLQFRPGADEFLGEEYNLWKDTGCGRGEGDASWFEEHVRWMCGDDAGHVLDFLAHLVQARGTKLSYALLIQGGQGIGKSLLGTLMRRVLGPTNVEFPTNEELHSNFTEWALGRELVVIQELMAVGRVQMANKLKPLITEDYVRVEEKHKTPYTVENHMNFLAFTNHEDPIPLEHDDRRFLVVMSGAEPREQAYYDDLFGRILSGTGAEDAAGWLARRDLTGFNPKRRAPRTDAKERMRRSGLHEVEAWLLERLEASEAPFDCDLVVPQDLVDCLPDRLQRAPRLSNIAGRFLRQEAGGVDLGQHRLPSGGRKVLWSVRRHEMMAGLSPKERAGLYDRTRLGADFGGPYHARLASGLTEDGDEDQ
jgi:hypothetical protein